MVSAAKCLRAIKRVYIFKLEENGQVWSVKSIGPRFDVLAQNERQERNKFFVIVALDRLCANFGAFLPRHRFGRIGNMRQHVEQVAKRPPPRAIRTARTYTIGEAATALGVTVGTVRGWVKAGLPIMATKRPFLILGDSLRSFIEARRDNERGKLLADQLYCLRCKTGRRPFGLLVDVLPNAPRYPFPNSVAHV